MIRLAKNALQSENTPLRSSLVQSNVRGVSVGSAIKGPAVHKCSVNERSTQATNTVSGQAILCSVCNRTFSRSGDLK